MDKYIKTDTPKTIDKYNETEGIVWYSDFRIKLNHQYCSSHSPRGLENWATIASQTI